MFRPQRRKNKVRGDDVAQNLLLHARRGVFAVNGDDGYPYAVPVNFLYDEAANRIYFHGSHEGHKADAVRRDDKVCFTVYGNETVKDEAWAPYLQSVVAFGRCRLLEHGDEAMAILKRLAMKYYIDESLADSEIARAGKAARIYEIQIEHLTAKEIQER